MSDDRVPYNTSAPARANPLESDEAACRTALRRINHWLSDDEYQATDEGMAQMLRAIKRTASEVLARPRSNGAHIDHLEEELAKLRGQLIDSRLPGMDEWKAAAAVSAGAGKSGSYRRAQQDMIDGLELLIAGIVSTLGVAATRVLTSVTKLDECLSRRRSGKK
jgi:hypothetical protein